MSIFRNKCATFVTLFPLLLCSQHGFTQSIEEVFVSTTRKEQPLQQLPLSIGVIDNETLSRQNADHPAEVVGLIPGVQLNRGSGAEHLTAIRSPVLTGGAGAGSFLYLQNGIPLRSPGFGNTNGLLGAHTELAHQLEVIRGPSGPIYGANAVHGVVNVIVPTAIDKPTNHFRISSDSQSRHKASGTYGLQHNEHYWLAGASVVKEDGYREDAGLDQQKGFIQHHVQTSHTKIDTLLSIYNLNQETAGYIFGADTLADRDLRRENAYPFAYRDAQSVHLQSRISTQYNTATHLQVTPYARWHEMEFLQHFLPSQAVENNGHASIGVQSDLIYSNDKLELLTGADFEYTQGYLREFQSLETVYSYTQGLHYDYEVSASNTAVFTNVDYALNAKLSASAGIRFDYTHYDYSNQTTADTVGRFLRLADQTDTFTTVSPKVSVQYTFSDSLSSYINLARANRPPQTSDLYRLQQNQTDDTAKAETMNALEWGFRHHINGIFSAHIAAYLMKKQNYFFRDADGYNVNNGETSHQGVELDISLNLPGNVRLASAINYAVHTYEFDRDVSRDYEIIQQGNEVDTAPRRFANTRIGWQPTNKFFAELQWVLMGSYYTDAANLHRYSGHQLFNLRTQYALNKTTHIDVFVKNATDELYAERADYAFGNERFFPAETRTVGVSIRLNL